MTSLMDTIKTLVDAEIERRGLKDVDELITVLEEEECTKEGSSNSGLDQ